MPLERRAVVEWIGALLDREAQRNAGDPGPVLARRLSNAELDYTIRDLTGVDIRPTKEFPVDPANEAGFDNSGESLAMSPALLKKYLAAARRVADHVVLKPAGFEFAPEPAVTETDRDKYCVRRIIEFYKRHEVDYARYFLAAWRFQNRSAFGKPNSPLREFAAEAALMPGTSRRCRRCSRNAGRRRARWESCKLSGASCPPTDRNKTTRGSVANGCATWSSGCGRGSRLESARCDRGAFHRAVSPSCCGGPGGSLPRG